MIVFSTVWNSDRGKLGPLETKFCHVTLLYSGLRGILFSVGLILKFQTCHRMVSNVVSFESLLCSFCLKAFVSKSVTQGILDCVLTCVVSFILKKSLSLSLCQNSSNSSRWIWVPIISYTFSWSDVGQRGIYVYGFNVYSLLLQLHCNPLARRGPVINLAFMSFTAICTH